MKLTIELLTRSLVIIIGSWCLGCHNKTTDSRQSTQQVTADTTQAIAFSVQYLFDTDKFPKEFMDTPMMVIRSEKIRLNRPFIVNGEEIVFVNTDALTDSILNNWTRPKPFMEVVNFEMENDNILIGLKFKTVGKRFDLLLKPLDGNKFSLEKLSEIEY